jgi:hypothetical protein
MSRFAVELEKQLIVGIALLSNCQLIKKENVLCRPKEMYLQKSKVLRNSLLSI